MAERGWRAYRRCLICALILLTSGGGILAYSADGDASIASVELVERLATPTDLLVLDVRTSQEFDTGHVPGARNIPHTELPQRLAEVTEYQHKAVVVYCERGGRASTASRVLQAAGFTSVRHLQGDMVAWRAQALPLILSPGRP